MVEKGGREREERPRRKGGWRLTAGSRLVAFV